MLRSAKKIKIIRQKIASTSSSTAAPTVTSEVLTTPSPAPRIRRRLSLGGEQITKTLSIALVPYRWSRLLASDSTTPAIYYISPSGRVLRNEEAVRQYLAEGHTCKCYLNLVENEATDGLIFADVFNFDVQVAGVWLPPPASGSMEERSRCAEWFNGENQSEEWSLETMKERVRMEMELKKAPGSDGLYGREILLEDGAEYVKDIGDGEWIHRAAEWTMAGRSMIVDRMLEEDDVSLKSNPSRPVEDEAVSAEEPPAEDEATEPVAKEPPAANDETSNISCISIESSDNSNQPKDDVQVNKDTEEIPKQTAAAVDADTDSDDSCILIESDDSNPLDAAPVQTKVTEPVTASTSSHNTDKQPHCSKLKHPQPTDDEDTDTDLDSELEEEEDEEIEVQAEALAPATAKKQPAAKKRKKRKCIVLKIKRSPVKKRR